MLVIHILSGLRVDETRLCLRLVFVVVGLVQTLPLPDAHKGRDAFAAAKPRLVVQVLELIVGDIVAHVAVFETGCRQTSRPASAH